MRLLLTTVTAVLLSATGLPRAAAAYSVARGSSGLRPHLGVNAKITGMPSQFQVGMDWEHAMTGPLLFVLGFDFGVANEFLGLGVNAGVKHRFLQLHPRVAPFIAGGGAFHLGIPAKSGEAITGLGIRFGFGVDFFPTPRIIPGLDIIFDVGPRFTPTIGAIGMVHVLFACTFLL